MMKYSDIIARWLAEIGYTHYFYVGGGNIMHLTESLDSQLIGVPVVHEVAAGVAAEYFNKVSTVNKALALVTAGPGITNIVTAFAGAWLESRELLVIGGQVKTSDLSMGEVRGRGIQEVDGTSIVGKISKLAIRLDEPVSSKHFYDYVKASWQPRKGPVFIEIPIDVQAKIFDYSPIIKSSDKKISAISEVDLLSILDILKKSKRPVVLLGGGISYSVAMECHAALANKKIPVMTTYNGADLFDGYNQNYMGRPNTWGLRSANIIIQKADFILAIGTRLGLQQTGFNWQEFGKNAKIVQIDIDQSELSKGHPKIFAGYPVCADHFLRNITRHNWGNFNEWFDYAADLRDRIPRVEDVNNTGGGFISPYDFITELEKLTDASDLIIPCSSGSAFTLTMQLYKQKLGQRIVTNKSLASMGYGLSGAIGASIACDNSRRTILIEGDGGFAQNLQELGTAAINKLNLKIFIFDDKGHASIRMTQQNYFNGRYLGCDEASGLGLPDWDQLFHVWGIEVMRINRGFQKQPKFLNAFHGNKIAAFLVTIDPEQTYYPKISSRIMEDGSMLSNPIHRMSPEIKYRD